MALARTARPAPPSLDDALARLNAGDGSPLPIEVGGRLVAYLVAPETVERMEDERDLAVLRAARAQAELRGEPGVSLDEIAACYGVDLGAAD